MGVKFSDLKDNFKILIKILIKIPIKRPDSSWATGGEPGDYDTEAVELASRGNSEPNFIMIQEKTEPEKHDSHYKNLSIEPNDLIDELSLHLNRRLIWPVGNVLKYSMRAPFKHKDELADLEKAYNYLGLAIEKLKEELDNE